MALSQQINFPAGTTTFPSSGAFHLPPDFQGGNISMSADGWPDGEYTVELLFSFDGGNTFPVIIGATFVSPFNFPPGKTHACFLQYRVGAGQPVPTHVKARVTAPSAFTSTVTITEV